MPSVAKIYVHLRMPDNISRIVARGHHRVGQPRFPPKIISVEEPHPRNPNFVTTEKFGKLRNRLYELLHEEIRKAVSQGAVVGPGT